MGERRNVTGTAYALTVFTAITPGREEELRTTIENLPLGPNSPIARLGTVHTSRLQIFDHLVHQGPSQKRESLNSNYLVFTAAFDGELEAFLDSVLDRIPEADTWWRHCVAYPGLTDRATFKRWIRHNQIHTSLFAVNSPNRSVSDVVESLALKEKLLDFAVAAHGLSDVELQDRFSRTFGEAG
jgi:hypothetical protein